MCQVEPNHREFQYDVFISYRWTEPDQSWVRNELYYRLVDAGLRVCMDVRDFMPGRNILAEMERATRESKHGLCIVTPDYLEDNRFVTLERNLLMADDPGGCKSRLIPVIARKAAPDPALSLIVAVDLTEEGSHDLEWRKLLSSLGAFEQGAEPPPILTSESKHVLHKLTDDAVQELIVSAPGNVPSDLEGDTFDRKVRSAPRAHRILSQLTQAVTLVRGYEDAVRRAVAENRVTQSVSLRQNIDRQLGIAKSSIIEYIGAYIDALPKDATKHFRIRFTDARPIHGIEAVWEWYRDDYLKDLLTLSRLAAEAFGQKGSVIRNFIVPSFTHLIIDQRLANGIRGIVNEHLRCGVGVRLVTLRRLDDIACPWVNFCWFEGGAVMALDARKKYLIDVDGEDGVFGHYHAVLESESPDVLEITEQNMDAYYDLLRDRAKQESYSQRIVSVDSVIGPDASGYTDHDVAAVWDNQDWWGHRRQKEWPFLRAWLDRHGIHSVLDCACGAGMQAIWMAMNGLKVEGADRSEDLIRRARSRADEQREQLGREHKAVPTFRVLTWLEIGRRYIREFDACLLLGGSLIHARPTDLEDTARSMARAVKPGGLILVDHRGRQHLRVEAGNPTEKFKGQERSVALKPDGSVVFSVTDGDGDTWDIPGDLHLVSTVVDAFRRAECDLEEQHYDHSMDGERPASPIWHHLTFRVRS